MSVFPLVPLTDMADIHDYLREPVSQTERNKREGAYPYYGATGQVGWIDGFRQEGKYVLLGEDGAPFFDSNRNKAYIVEGKCWVNNHAHVLKGKVEICDDDFLCFALNWADYSEAVTGSTRLKLPQSTMNRLFIPKPHIDEQRQIAARLKAQLAEVETARQATQVQLRDAALLRQRLLQQTFAALADVRHKVLGEWATTTSGSTPSRGDKHYWSPAEIPWVKTGEVAFAPVTQTEEAISKQALAECSLALLPPESVLIAMIGQGKTRGQSAILKIEATTNQNCFAIFPNETWDADFLHHWLMASYFALRELSASRGGSQSALNGALLNALKIPAPDIADQRRFVTQLKQQLAETDALRAALEQQLRDLEALPQRILAQAFDPGAPTT
jgi:restriction endonuclease S subunit